MAISLNREIVYKNWIEFIEHKTGKIIKTWRQDPCKDSRTIIFMDNTSIDINECEPIPETFNFKPIPKNYCASCGEISHSSYFDFLGRCETTLKRFWKKARKVYWYRYLK